MHIHILGICGTFMGGLAQLAAAAGHRVSGADSGIYPPMSDQLAAAGIAVVEGWDPAQLQPRPDLVVVGNALARGNPVVETVLDDDLPFTSGPAWLATHLLRGRHVLAVAGTHGKTTTASMLAHVLEQAGTDPGFLIGGVPTDFGISARRGSGPFFVVEADEYDSAFFDKRSKFVHYGPRTLVLTGLEFDHADIFRDLADIERQFHHLVRTVPGSGRIIHNAADDNLERVLAMGCWTPVAGFAPPGSPGRADWRVTAAADGSHFRVEGPGAGAGEVDWPLLGEHNVANATAAIAAAHHVGIDLPTAATALSTFGGVRRRLERRARCGDVTVYDDFAHHPTAIATTLAGLRAKVGGERIVAVVDLASNTMRAGVHADRLAPALRAADRVYLHAGAALAWDIDAVARELPDAAVFRDTGALAQALAQAEDGGHIVLMSNGGFGGLSTELPRRLAQRDGGRT